MEEDWDKEIHFLISSMFSSLFCFVCLFIVCLCAYVVAFFDSIVLFCITRSETLWFLVVFSDMSRGEHAGYCAWVWCQPTHSYRSRRVIQICATLGCLTSVRSAVSPSMHASSCRSLLQTHWFPHSGQSATKCVVLECFTITSWLYLPHYHIKRKNTWAHW